MHCRLRPKVRTCGSCQYADAFCASSHFMQVSSHKEYVYGLGLTNCAAQWILPSGQGLDASSAFLLRLLLPLRLTCPCLSPAHRPCLLHHQCCSVLCRTAGTLISWDLYFAIAQPLRPAEFCRLSFCLTIMTGESHGRVHGAHKHSKADAQG